MYDRFEVRCNSKTKRSQNKASAKYIARLTFIMNLHVELLGIINFLYEISNFFMIFSHRD